MKKIIESLKRMRKAQSDRTYQRLWNSLNRDEQLELMLQVVNRSNKGVA